MDGSRRRTPTIIDCDPGCDDVLALLLAIAAPSLDIIAYIPQFGNTDVQAAYDNILKLYGVLDTYVQQHSEHAHRFPNLSSGHGTGSTRPLLVKGASGPLGGKTHTAKYFHGADGLGDITNSHAHTLPLPSREQVSHLLSFPESINNDEAGYKAILRLLEDQADGSVTYIALGPLTNLALALRENEELFKQKVGLVSIMGGALDVPGNTSPVAEFNVYADATAAHEVFTHAATLPIYLAPLDITSRHLMHWRSYADAVDPGFPSDNSRSASSEDDHLVHFTSAFLRHTARIMEKYGRDGMELHDPLAVFFAVQNHPDPARAGQAGGGGGALQQLAPGWKVEKRDFVVERHGEYTAGMCVVDRRHSSKASKREKGRSRAELQEELDGKGKAGKNGTSGSPEENGQEGMIQADDSDDDEEDPAEIQLDDPADGKFFDETGVNVIVATPGSRALVDHMLRSIWGASV